MLRWRGHWAGQILMLRWLRIKAPIMIQRVNMWDIGCPSWQECPLSWSIILGMLPLLCLNLAEVVWNHGLLKRAGVCHGISGNAYVFLSLYRLTCKMEFLYRVKAFACFIELINLYQMERCMEVIAPTHFSKGQVVWLIFFWTWSNPLRPGSQLMNSENLCIMEEKIYSLFYHESL